MLEIENPVARIVMPPPSKPCDKIVSREELKLLLGKLEPTMALIELLPASQTLSLGVMMKPEVVNGNETDVQSGVQA